MKHIRCKAAASEGQEVECPPDEEFTALTEQEIADLITCAASVFIREEYTINFPYTDLQKQKNYIGFESGVFCVFPGYEP